MNSREATLSRAVDWADIVRVIALMSAGLLITTLGLPQFVTGPLVNALLILTVLWCGVSQALFVGLVTPMGAALSGILPVPLAIMIPFIALGNGIFVSVFGGLQRVNRWLALGVAAVLKFGLLYLAVTVLVARPLSLVIAGQPEVVAVPNAFVGMMSWPQLLTALAGGAIAFGIDYASRRLAR